MPKKAKKTQKIAILSDSDQDEDDFKRPKKKGHKFAISDSDDDDDDFSSPKPSTSKGKTHYVKSSIFVQNIYFDKTYFRNIFLLEKIRQNAIVLEFLSFDNFHFTKKISNIFFLLKNSVKMQLFFNVCLLTTFISRKKLWIFFAREILWNS